MRVALMVLGVAVAGCALPPERVERDRIIMAAVQPCKERHAERLYNVDMMSVNPDGTVRYWYKGGQVSAAQDITNCLADATKGLRFGPWLSGRLVKASAAEVAITSEGKDSLIPVRVNGVLGTMALRPNADFTFLTSAYAQRAGVRVVRESPTIRIRTGGQSVAAPFARARIIEIGAAQVEAADVVIYEQVRDLPGVDGVLGKPLLSHFKVNIDKANARLKLEPYRRP